jgi:hypothetical protein
VPPRAAPPAPPPDLGEPPQAASSPEELRVILYIHPVEALRIFRP